MLKSFPFITVEYSKPALDRFRKECRRAFPKELLGFLLGHKRSDDHWVVEDVWVPPDATEASTHDSIDAEAYGRWEVEAAEYAKEEGQEIVGDIHSHPYYYEQHGPSYHRIGFSRDWAAPSEGDFAVGWPGRIAGIVQVQQLKSGKLWTKPKFYPPAPRVVPVAIPTSRPRRSAARDKTGQPY